MIQVQIEQRELQVMLTGLDARLRDLTPVWGKVHDIMIALLRQHFRSQGAYAGAAWVPLSPAYAAWKKRHYPGKTILRREDTLYESLVSKTHASHVWRTGPSFAEYGTRVSYARFHHFGTKRGLPVRKVIPSLTRAEGERIVDAILAYLFRAMRGRR
jgi:phage gpG-like protein